MKKRRNGTWVGGVCLVRIIDRNGIERIIWCAGGLLEGGQ